MRYIRSALLLAVCLLWSPVVAAAGQTSETSARLPSNPQVLVGDVVQNGLRQARNEQIRWSFREIISKDDRRETREVCQTSTATIDRLIAINGLPLSVEQQKREDARLQAVLDNGSEIRKETQKQRQDSTRQGRMFATFPEAFRYKYAGNDEGLVKLTFEPNPQFVPSSRQEEVLHHLEGTMWIEPNQKRLVRIDGELTSEVRFVGGLLGYLDKGGVFSVKFKEVDSAHWVMAELHVDMNGRALLFKTIAVQERREFDDYHLVPSDLSLQQGAELLEKQANSSRQSAAANNPRKSPTPSQDQSAR